MLTNLNRRLNTTNRSSTSRGGFKKVAVRWIILLLFLVVAIVLPIKGAVDGLKETQAQSRALASAYGSQNFGQMVEALGGMKNSLSKADISLTFLIWLRAIPILGGYYGDIKGLTSGGVAELAGFETLFKELKPKEKELGFLGTPLAKQDRISQIIKLLEAAMPHLDKVKGNFKNASEAVKDIDTNKYPSNFAGLKLKETMTISKNLMMGTSYLVNDNRRALEIIPSALGLKEPRSYLILFQNDKEIRPTGGFITAYAFLKVDQGQISSTTSDDIYRLDERLQATCLSKICPLSPPAPISKYLPEVDGKPRKSWSLRDSNISADVPNATREFERMYLLLGQGLPWDGIIYIDSQVVEELIEITGPIDIFGTPYSSKIDSRCNCPSVIYELENYAEIAAKGTQDRKAILGVLMSQILAKVVGAETEKIPAVLNTVVRLANHKHIMFNMHDDKEQTVLSELNWIGQIKEYSGDYLHINDANFAGGKSNLYVTQTVTQEISKDSNGYKKKVIIEYKNPQAFNTWLNGINRDYVRLFVPKGSKLTSSKGSDDPVNTIEENDKIVFEAFITVRPQNSRKLEFEYTIPYSPNGPYKLLVQKQPGAKDFRYVIKLNGSTKADVMLDQDKELKF